MANNHMQRCPTYLPRKYRSIPDCDTVHTQLGNRDRYQSVTLLHTDYSSEWNGNILALPSGSEDVE